MLHLLLFLAAVALPPKPARYVTDNAGVLGDARANALNEKLAQFERDTSDQVLVYVDRDLPPDTTIEEMGAEAIRKWGVGQKGKDNGAILFVFTGEKKMRIETGYGLESTLTDAKSKRITNTVMKPLMQRGDLAGGIEAGADAMLTVIRGAGVHRHRNNTGAKRPGAHHPLRRTIDHLGRHRRTRRHRDSEEPAQPRPGRWRMDNLFRLKRFVDVFFRQRLVRQLIIQLGFRLQWRRG